MPDTNIIWLFPNFYFYIFYQNYISVKHDGRENTYEVRWLDILLGFQDDKQYGLWNLTNRRLNPRCHLLAV